MTTLTDPVTQPPESVKLGGVSLWDLAVSYPVTSHLTVRGKIANLFDKDYETVYGYKLVTEYTLSGSYTFDPRPTVLVFDSGVGGLSVYNEIRQLLPDLHYIYAFDNVAFPMARRAKSLSLSVLLKS